MLDEGVDVNAISDSDVRNTSISYYKKAFFSYNVN